MATWSPVTNPDPDIHEGGYEVTLSPYPFFGSPTTFTSQTDWKFGPIPAGTYTVSVRSINGFASGASATATIVVPDTAPPYVSLSPRRVLDTRPDGRTVDGQQQGQGIRPAGSQLRLPVAGRADVPAGATSVSVNVTATESTGPGFVTSWPCDGDRPNASNLNYAGGENVANSAIVKLSTDGSICLFTYGRTHLVVDVAGYSTTTSTYVPIRPERMMDTRPDGVTIDGKMQAFAPIPAGGSTGLELGGRGSLPGRTAANQPSPIKAVTLNVTVTEARSPGFITVWPCDGDRPNASNVNYVPGQNVAASVTVATGYDGEVCLFSYATAHVIVDVEGYFTGANEWSGVRSARLVDTRADGTTVDGAEQATGPLDAGTTRRVRIAGRGGLRGVVRAATLNITATGSTGPGFLTVWPCDGDRPNASNLNYSTGQNIANSVTTKLSNDGDVCIFSYATTHLVVDVTGAYLA